MGNKCAYPQCSKDIIKKDRRYCSRQCSSAHRKVKTEVRKRMERLMGERPFGMFIDLGDDGFTEVTNIVTWGDVFLAYYWNFTIYVQPSTVEEGQVNAFVYRPGETEPAWQGNFRQAPPASLLRMAVTKSVVRIRQFYTLFAT